mmetsp:Transcript_7606/g.18129  ORF Transcript_7606/g.18129 Transcript_7606/m.18129 type:complete len:249 (+) Transcript_7606:1978-2724(+)
MNGAELSHIWQRRAALAATCRWQKSSLAATSSEPSRRVVWNCVPCPTAAVFGVTGRSGVLARVSVAEVRRPEIGTSRALRSLVARRANRLTNSRSSHATPRNARKTSVWMPFGPPGRTGSRAPSPAEVGSPGARAESSEMPTTAAGPFPAPLSSMPAATKVCPASPVWTVSLLNGWPGVPARRSAMVSSGGLARSLYKEQEMEHTAWARRTRLIPAPQTRGFWSSIARLCTCIWTTLSPRTSSPARQS